MQIVVELGIRSQVFGLLTIATVFFTRSALMGFSGGGLNSNASVVWLAMMVRHVRVINLKKAAILRLAFMGSVHQEIFLSLPNKSCCLKLCHINNSQATKAVAVLLKDPRELAACQ